LQVKEEQEVVARRMKAGGLGRLKIAGQQAPKHFFWSLFLIQIFGCSAAFSS